MSARTPSGLQPAHTVVSGVTGLDDWYAAGDGTHRHGGLEGRRGRLRQVHRRVHRRHRVRRRSRCAPTPRPSRRCAGAATAVALSGVAADGDGGVYVWCTVTPTSRRHRRRRHAAEPRLRHRARVAVADPGIAARQGHDRRPSTSTEGARRSCCSAPPAAPGSPSSASSPTVTRRRGWSQPISPYSPAAAGPPPAATAEPIGITAGVRRDVIAWREAARVKRPALPGRRRQALAHAGRRVTMTRRGQARRGRRRRRSTSPVRPARGIVARHLLSTGAEAAGLPVARPGLGLEPAARRRASPRTAPATSSSATVTRRPPPSACSGVVPGHVASAPGARSAIAAIARVLYSAAASDGAGGAYVLGARRSCWRFANGGAAAGHPPRPRHSSVQYGKSRHRRRATSRGPAACPWPLARSGVRG